MLVDSKWIIKIEDLVHLGITLWFQSLLDTEMEFPIPLDEVNPSHLIHFALLVFERMWMERNRIRMGKPSPDWHTFSQKINSNSIFY